MKRRSGGRWLAVAVLVAILAPLPSRGIEAQEFGGAPIRFIRDAEIEHYLRELATPIYQAAGVAPDSVQIVIVESNTVNAFVAEGMNEFFYTGLLLLTDSPEQLAGVIAHETGHIAGGHLVRGQEEMRNASAEQILGMLLAVAAGAATGNGGVAAAGMSGMGQMTERGVLGFTRTQEASADAAGMSFLDGAGMSTRGMLEFFRKLQGQELLPAARQDEYVRTHPLTEDRIDAVQAHLDRSKLKDARLPDKYYVMHERMKAKLLGFLQPETALLRYTDTDPRLTARYARAIALYRTGQPDDALSVTQTLIAQEPKNPFFYELKGQIEFDNGRLTAAVADYRHANDLLPDSALLRQAYGHALLESCGDAPTVQPNGSVAGTSPQAATTCLDLAIQQLLESNRLEDRVAQTWRFLASAWGRKADLTGDPGLTAMATYALAEEAAANGKDKQAGGLAARAMKGLRRGSPYWLRAQDISLSTAGDDDKHKD